MTHSKCPTSAAPAWNLAGPFVQPMIAAFGPLLAIARLLGLLIAILGAVGALPPPGALVLSNHQSYLDIVGLGALSKSFFMAKAELGGWPLLGLGTRLAAIPFVLRDNAVSGALVILETEKRLRHGFGMVVFPEGTTSAGRQPLPRTTPTGSFTTSWSASSTSTSSSTASTPWGLATTRVARSRGGGPCPEWFCSRRTFTPMTRSPMRTFLPSPPTIPRMR
jgi:1-acyl-sn-glycerol-3-phosphate acyltransferase